jgi:methionine sulfoxide reductase heme-binding subunit
MRLARLIKWIKIPVFLLCLAPAATLLDGVLYAIWHVGYPHDLSANPLEFIRNSTGFWTLVFLCITLAITPARRLLRINELIRFRRMMGLFAFFYVALHFVTYIWFEESFDLSAMLQDVVQRPFITMGFVAFLAMIPLAVTSTSGWVRRLGGKNWQLLHRAIYISAVAGVIHYWWKVKSDITVPLRFAVIVGVLLAYRVVVFAVKRRGAAAKQRVKQHAPISG